VDSGGGARHGQCLAGRSQADGPRLRASVESGARLSAVDYLDADATRTALGQTMGDFHATYDLLLTPTVAVPALPVAPISSIRGRALLVDWTPFSYPST